MSAERWRVVHADGRETVVSCTRGFCRGGWLNGRRGWVLTVEMIAGTEYSIAETSREAVAGSLTALGCDDAVEIRGPGELTSAEQLAQRNAALSAALFEYSPECEECAGVATHVFYDDVSRYVCDRHRITLPAHGVFELEHAEVLRSLGEVPR